VTTVLVRLDALEAALLAAAPPSDGGPAQRTAADYGAKSKTKGGGRKVASKAGEARYGLPIGTPLGKTKAKTKDDAATQQSYDVFMAADTPAKLAKAASWMSNDDLARAADGVFSIDKPNERDQAASLALVKELADRGIDPHTLGYTGSPVVLNPNPKKDPVARAAETIQKKAARDKKAGEAAVAKAQHTQDAAAKKAASDQVKAEHQAAAAVKAADAAVKKAAADATTKSIQDARAALAQAIAQGVITEAEARRRMGEITAIH
jgi:hypothetical protein